MVFNDTRVIKARLYGVKDTGGKVEVMVERVLDTHCALAVMRASHPAKARNQAVTCRDNRGDGVGV